MQTSHQNGRVAVQEVDLISVAWNIPVACPLTMNSVYLGHLRCIVFLIMLPRDRGIFFMA
jgi:hypothetical protein